MQMEKRFRELVDFTLQMGDFAKTKQMKVSRSVKKDGSFVTETDLAINDKMIQRISELYPEANIVTEENDTTPFNPDAPLTFAVDPIDGTTAYSRGMANWGVSVGIVDKNRKPVGGIVYLPRYGRETDSSLFFREPGSDAVYLNDKPYEISMEGRDDLKDMIVGDRTWKHITFPQDFNCKMRSLCACTIDMLTQILFIDFGATINDHLCYVWDVAGTDAILSAYGIHSIMSDGTRELYSDKYLKDRCPYPLPVYAATEKTLKFMLENFRVDL